MSQYFRDRLYVCSRNTSVTLARLGIRQPGAVDRSRRGVRPCRRHTGVHCPNNRPDPTYKYVQREIY